METKTLSRKKRSLSTPAAPAGIVRGPRERRRNAVRSKGEDVEEDPFEQLMPNGLTVAETNERTARITEAIHREAFAKGFPMFYRDERAKAQNEFIRANPDGSEDLILYDMDTSSYSVIAPLLPAGKGYWARLSNAGQQESW